MGTVKYGASPRITKHLDWMCVCVQESLKHEETVA